MKSKKNTYTLKGSHEGGSEFTRQDRSLWLQGLFGMLYTGREEVNDVPDELPEALRAASNLILPE